MQYSCWELGEIIPIVNGDWDINILYEYLVLSCYTRYKSALLRIINCVLYCKIK